jgi:prevent-host-death family protein
MVKAMKQVALSEIKDDLSKYLRLAENQQIIITRHGKPAGVLVGFASEDDWFDYKLENDPRFLQRIARARKSLQTGKGIKLEDVHLESKARPRRNSAWSRKSRRRSPDAG